MKNQSSILSVAIVLILTASSLPAQQTTAPSETPAKPAETPAAAAEPAAPTLDFGVFRSQTIVGKVWAAYNAKNHAEAQAYARKCIEMYKDKAVEMQKALKAPATVEEEVHKNWALNDVGTCYYILGDSLHTEG